MNDKEKALREAMEIILKRYGKGAIMKLGREGKDQDIKSIPSGSLRLDDALGVGGVPRGRIVEIFGPESSGKTTLALHIAAEAQKMGGSAAFIDAEHAFDLEYAKNLGINVDELLVSQPTSGEEALEIVDILVTNRAVDVIVVDSVAALTPRAELEGMIGDTFVGLQARLMSQALRKLTAKICKSDTCVIFINQLREKIGVMSGNPETTPGGRALKFYSSVRMEVRKKDLIKEGTEILGHRMQIKIVKNKVAAPFKTVECALIYGRGIEKVTEIIETGISLGIIEKKGSWFSIKGENVAQGFKAMKEYLETTKEQMQYLVGEIRKSIFTRPGKAVDQVVS